MDKTHAQGYTAPTMAINREETTLQRPEYEEGRLRSISSEDHRHYSASANVSALLSQNSSGRAEIPRFAPAMEQSVLSGAMSTEGGFLSSDGIGTLPSRTCPPYEAGYEAALEHLQILMRQSRGTDIRPRPSDPNSLRRIPHPSPVGAPAYPPAVENTGSAMGGHPRPTWSPLDSPLITPPDTSLVPVPPEPVQDDTPAPTLAEGDGVVTPSALTVWGSGNRDSARRALQRRAETNFANHKKAGDGSKFIIKCDEAGNIITNKLRVTSAVNSWMARFVDIAQIHYEDDDDRFVLVESLVRDQFDFDPPLKKNWFPDYMRKKLEKSRSVFRKHHDDTGGMHPECNKDKHSALVAWWKSPAGSSRSGRMKQMNANKSTRRLSLSYGGVQREHQSGSPQVLLYVTSLS